MSIFDRINAAAETHKRAAWAAYTPLERLCFADDDSSHALAGEDERAEPTMVINRPTEIAALQHARYGYQWPECDPVIRLTPYVELRYCIRCKRKRMADHFSYDARTPSKLSFCCKSCKEDGQRGIWRRVAVHKAQRGFTRVQVGVG